MPNVPKYDKLNAMPGTRYGKLVCMYHDDSTPFNISKGYWYFRCDCGNVIRRRGIFVTAANGQRSCGCAHADTNHRKRIERIQGKTFGYLTAIEPVYDSVYYKNGRIAHTKWKCRCVCGKITIVQQGNLVRGDIQSCGCKAREKASEVHYKHGLSRHPLYSTYQSMRSRCYKQSDPRYQSYGKRGIGICPEWYNPNDIGEGLKRFVEWAESNGWHESPKGTPRGEVLTIEREDVDGWYKPDNCTWIKGSEQARNKSDTHHVYYNGHSGILADIYHDFPGLTWQYYTRRSEKWGFSDDAIIESWLHREWKLRKDERGNYVDKDGFIRLIHSYHDPIVKS